jgi:hypothetical protein
MAFTAAESISQILGICSSFSVEDTSDYTDEPKNSFTSRRIFVYDTKGNTLVPAGTTTPYIDFSFADYPDDIIELEILDWDCALFVIMELISSDPQPTSEYTVTEVTNISLCYTNQFEYGLIQDLTANPSLKNDQIWMNNLSLIQTEIDNSNEAIKYQDIQAAQAAIDRAKYIIDNQQFFF